MRKWIVIALAMGISTVAALSQQNPAGDSQAKPRQKKAPNAAAAQNAGGTEGERAAADPLAAPKILPGTPEAKAINAMFNVHEFSQVRISPDGKQVAWVESLTEKSGAPSANSAIYSADLKNPTAARRISASGSGAAHAEGDIAWSPDSKRIAFLSDAEKPGQTQLYVVSAAGGAARRLTQFKGNAITPGWSPDGKTIAVLYTENAIRIGSPLMPEAPDVGVINDDSYEQRLTLVDAMTGKIRVISPADLYVYEFDWSPDGKQFVITDAKGNGDDNWYIATLDTIDATSGELKRLYKPDMQIADPRWSPGGEQVAFIGGIMSDEPSTGGDIYVVSADGAAPRDVTPNINASPSWLTWTSGGREILFTVEVDGRSGVAAVDVGSAKSRVIWSDVASISSEGLFGASLSLANDGATSAIIKQSFVRPPEIWAGEIGQWTQITQRNKGLDPPWGPAQSLHWKSDEYNIQGWLLYPPDVDPSVKYPLVVDVHGGPAAMVSPHWPSRWTYAATLLAAGFFVLEPNPRGSYGSGEAFTRANVKDFGGGDFRDIVAGINEAAANAPVDPNRVGITGWSYGGYMTMWAVTQTDRFKAAVSGAGLSNYQSYYGENKIDQWMIPYFGASVYDDPAVYAKSSPITFIRKAKTPTLIVVGERDGECPAPQSFEFWHALKFNGTRTQFVVYPGEGHLFLDPEHSRDVAARAVAWFRHFL